MLTPEQKETWRRLDSLTSGLMELLEMAVESQNLSSEASDIARCHLVVACEVRQAIFDLYPVEEMDEVNQGGAA